jgi:CopG family transcriptional regulator/antitoxin EndoAI
MAKRINIILPDKTVAVLNRVTTKGSRSRFIDRAVRQLIETEGKATLRAHLKAEAIANADRDLEMSAEWFPLEEEAWQMFEKTSGKPAGKQVRRSKHT